MDPLRFIVYSDYLCPWCYNASVRLRRLEREYAGRVELEWRSYLLRPHPDSGGPRSLGRFRAYTRSWLRPAAEAESGAFQPWQGEEGPPSHSVPPHVVAKAAARLGPDAFARIHERLLHAYFRENRDITRRDTLRALWTESDLPADAFETSADPALVEQTLDEHCAAQEIGVTGVPAVQLAGEEPVIVGAHPSELYRRWIERAFAERERAGHRS